MDFEQARFNMVEQQIRTWDVLDQEVLDLLFAVKREHFVPAAYRALAFADLEIPLGDGEHMWTPKMEARVVQEARAQARRDGVGNRHRQRLSDRAAGAALGGGHQRRDQCRVCSPRPGRHLASAGIGNVRLEKGDGARGWGDETYDAIVLTGSTPVLPDSWFRQLKPGGRLFAVVGDAPVMTARLARWSAPGAIVQLDLFETVIAPLKNAPQPARFVF